MKDPAILSKNRKEMVEQMQNNFGYLFCQNCYKSKAFKFEVHHIVFRSERPQHPNLHNKENLIICCSDCHNKFHNEKSSREKLVKIRKLDKIFNI